ncbi:MAG: 3-phosphoshikimate 1-carboxyvinyltransferase [Simkania negevensis]|nr:3-phosphoshikimate 1-carboxyvinyltransferase [Simkania negevensis]
MAKTLIKPGQLKGNLEIPSSKSHTIRSFLFALLAKGKSTIYHPLLAEDTKKMLKAIQLFGARIKQFPQKIEIEGVGEDLPGAEDIIDAGNSGQIFRFMGGVASLSSHYTVLTGDESIRKGRPITPLLAALTDLGIFAKSAKGNGSAPILIKGILQGGEASFDGSDSQPVSALLIASALAKGKTLLKVTNPGETPWIDLTLHWFDFLSLPYQRRGYTEYTLPGYGKISPFSYRVPGDFSSLAYPLVAAILTNSEISLSNVDLSDVQGDKKIIHTLQKMGAQLEVEEKEKRLHVKRGSYLQGIEIDVSEMIDALPILAVVGSFATGKTLLYNGTMARKKECDRISAITSELKKMGGKIEEKADGLVIEPAPLKGNMVQAYQDHRMVMALSVAALAAKGNTLVNGSEWINKSYPSFYQDLISLKANIKTL